jgi:transmembrane sensor
MVRRETSEEINETAADWAMRIDEAQLDAVEQATFDAWLMDDVRRVGAFARAQAVLVYAKRAKALGSGFEPATFDAVVGRGGTTSIVAEPSLTEPSGAEGPTRRRLLIGGGLAVAASGMAAIFIPLGRVAARNYETGKGEIRVIPLADGSTVTLNSDSRIATRIDTARREVELIAGEALFKVATAGSLPFTVEAGDTSLRANGATFAICRLDQRPLQVQVCDGKVEIARDTFAARNRLVLQANMQAIMPPDGSIVDHRVTPDALERDLAWQEGMLSFEDTPLSEAADEFARYSDRRILVASRAVGAETVTGRYAANNPDGFAKAVALGLDLHVRLTSDGILLAR